MKTFRTVFGVALGIGLTATASAAQRPLRFASAPPSEKGEVFGGDVRHFSGSAGSLSAGAPHLDWEGKGDPLVGEDAAALVRFGHGKSLRPRRES